MGNFWDVNFRAREVRRYLSDKVQRARKIIYELGRAVAGTGVDGMLKSTSSVPVVVSGLFSPANQWYLMGCRTECVR